MSDGIWMLMIFALAVTVGVILGGIATSKFAVI